MSAVDVIKLEEVQTWLERTKLQLGNLPDDLVDSEKTSVFAAVGQIYDVSTWATYENTPALIRKIIAMRVAGLYYMRQYSEATGVEENSYAIFLLQRADMLLKGVVGGSLILEEDPTGVLGGDPDFWPNNTTGSAEVFDASGTLVGAAGSEDIKFRMGTRF